MKKGKKDKKTKKTFFEELAVEDKQVEEEEKVPKEKEQQQQQQQVQAWGRQCLRSPFPALLALSWWGLSWGLAPGCSGGLGFISPSTLLSAAKKETRHPKRPTEEGCG